MFTHPNAIVSGLRRAKFFQSLCHAALLCSLGGCLIDFDRYKFSGQPTDTASNTASATASSANSSGTLQADGPTDAGSPAQSSTTVTNPNADSGPSSAGSQSSTAVACDPNKTVPFTDTSGEVRATNNAELEVLRGVVLFPRRLTITGSTTDLSALDCLETVGTLLVTNASISNLDLPVLSSISGSLTLDSNASLASPGLGALTQIGGNLVILNNDRIAGIGLASLTTIVGDLDIEQNDTLTELGLTSLSQLNQGTLIDNPRLPTCQILELQNRLDGDSFTASGNDDSAMCL